MSDASNPAPAGSEEIAALAGRVLAEILERQAFLFADPGDPENIPAPEDECVSVRMTFRGHAEGCLRIFMPRSLGVELAANVLGTETDDPLANKEALDACKELLNVVCGNILTTIWGTTPVFDLSIPECELITGSAFLEEIKRDAAGLFLVDDRPILLRVTLAAGGSEPC
ncbi:MAG TPA: chemotaxis protein CheX [Fibrobacteria bacterium]|nr:chemotaxis protein CheX [Fibrobacteria bacterium]